MHLKNDENAEQRYVYTLLEGSYRKRCTQTDLVIGSVPACTQELVPALLCSQRYRYTYDGVHTSTCITNTTCSKH